MADNEDDLVDYDEEEVRRARRGQVSSSNKHYIIPTAAKVVSKQHQQPSSNFLKADKSVARTTAARTEASSPSP